jgi:hypothetical protein
MSHQAGFGPSARLGMQVRRAELSSRQRSIRRGHSGSGISAADPAGGVVVGSFDGAPEGNEGRRGGPEGAEGGPGGDVRAAPFVLVAGEFLAVRGALDAGAEGGARVVPFARGGTVGGTCGRGGVRGAAVEPPVDAAGRYIASPAAYRSACNCSTAAASASYSVSFDFSAS